MRKERIAIGVLTSARAMSGQEALSWNPVAEIVNPRGANPDMGDQGDISCRLRKAQFPSPTRLPEIPSATRPYQSATFGAPKTVPKG